jgi:hypothetical protein
MLATHQSRLIEMQAEFARQSAELQAARTQSAATYKYVQQLTLTNFHIDVTFCDLAKDRRNLSEIDASTSSGFDRFDQAHLEILFSCMRDAGTKNELVRPLNVDIDLNTALELARDSATAATGASSPDGPW